AERSERAWPASRVPRDPAEHRLSADWFDRRVHRFFRTPARGGSDLVHRFVRTLNERAQFWDARRDLKHPGSFKNPGCCPTIRLGHLGAASGGSRGSRSRWADAYGDRLLPHSRLISYGPYPQAEP